MSDDENTQLQTTDDANKGLPQRDRYAPRNFGELMKFAKVVVNSQLCPSHIKRPEDAVMIVQQGAELGLSPMQALQNMHSIKGKVGLGADLMKGICQNSGEVDRWEYEESTDERCILHVKRVGREALPPVVWTIEDAREKGLLSSNVWRNYPRQMLRHRADAEAARTAFPDILSGLYTPEELQAIPDGQGQGDPRPRPEHADQKSVQTSQQDDDVVDAEYTEGDQQQSDERPVHFTERDFSGNPEQSDKAEWQAASKRYFAICDDSGFTDTEADPDITEKLRMAIKRRHNVESWKQIPAEILEKWGDLLEDRPLETDDGSPRYELAMKFIHATGVEEAA